MLVKECKNIMDCRWSEYIPKDIMEYEVLFDNSEADYSGHVEFLAINNESYKNKYAYVQYSYGSCSGCDEWESMFEYDHNSDEFCKNITNEIE